MRQTGPELREADEARVKRILGDVIGYASVILVRCIDQSPQMRKDLLHLLWGEAKYSENGDSGLQVLLP